MASKAGNKNDMLPTPGQLSRQGGNGKGRTVPRPEPKAQPKAEPATREPSRPVQSSPPVAPPSVSIALRPKIDPSMLKRNKPPAPPPPPEEPGVANDMKAKVVDYLFNSTDDKLREVTIVDRIQGRLFPVMDTLNELFDYVIEIAEYRQDKANYIQQHSGRTYPVMPHPIKRWLHRTTQWQKSVGGTNMSTAKELALAEQESQNEDEYGADNSYNYGEQH